MNHNHSSIGIRLIFAAALSLASGCGSPAADGATETRASLLIGGSGTSNFLLQTDGLLKQVVAFFPSVTNVTNEFDSFAGTFDTYSLQLNTNRFPSGLCGPNNPASCRAWEQFVYKVNPTQGQLLIVYYLVNYSGNPGSNPPNPNNPPSPACPLNMQPDGIGGCFFSLTKDLFDQQPRIGELGTVTMIASVADGVDSVTLSRQVGGVVELRGSDAFGLQGAWNQAEFNVFGITNGGQAMFLDSNSTISVSLNGRTTDGSTAAPQCVQPAELTGESNSLNLVPRSCRPNGGAAPGITFLETNDPSVQASPCP